MWMQFMEKFLKDKPNDQFPKGPPPDREILARRGEAERAIRKAAAEEAEANSQVADELADQVKSAAQEREEPKPRERGGVPKLVEPDGGIPPRHNREDRPRVEKPPPDDRGKESDGEKKKRGKNG